MYKRQEVRINITQTFIVNHQQGSYMLAHFLHAVQRLSLIHILSVFYNFRHLAVEHCHDKGVDVRTIDVGIGHDHHRCV